LITEREQNILKRFSLDGTFIEKFELPGAYICRPVIHGKEVYLATIWSGDKSPNTGFISVLDETNRLVSAPGGIAPDYDSGGNLNPMRQESPLFKHPHDVCVDSDENLYVCQWNAGKTYPIKLVRV
jgi:peptidylamidoglycolate lyase